MSRSKTRKKKRIREQLSTRDELLCGIHTGGCHRRIEGSVSIDHIIPQSFGPKKKFDGFWNFQAMCVKCNNEDKGGQINGLPSFNCICHYFAITGEDLALVYEDSRPAYKQYNSTHVILSNIVNHPSNEELVKHMNGELESWRNDARIISGRHNSGFVGFSVNPPIGHFVGGIHSMSIEKLNQKPGIYKWQDGKYVPADQYKGHYYKHLHLEDLPTGTKLMTGDTRRSGS